MVLEQCREVALVADDKKTNQLCVEDKVDYFIETHIRQNEAKCFFCNNTIKLNPDLKKIKLICKIGDKMNLNQKSGFVNDHILDGDKPFAYYYYESEWIYEKQSFEIYVDFIFSNQKSNFI